MDDYHDNRNIISTITRKPDGIFALVDEASKQPGDDDVKKDRDVLLPSLDKTYEHAQYHEEGNPHGVYEKAKKVDSFIVHHYAGAVTYNVVHFIEKNKDELGAKLAELLERQIEFAQLRKLAGEFRTRMVDDQEERLAKLAAKKEETKSKGGNTGNGGGRKGGGKGGGQLSSRGGKGKAMKKAQKTVSKNFSEQLDSLMDRLHQTDHRYIRCLKPNHELKGGVWDAGLMERQLSYSGTLEVCKVRKAGLNERHKLEDFYRRYRIAALDIEALGGRETGSAGSHLRDCVLRLMAQLEEPNSAGRAPLEDHKDKYRVGKTIMFMQNRDILDILDKLLLAKHAMYASQIAAFVRGQKSRATFKNHRTLRLTLIGQPFRHQTNAMLSIYALNRSLFAPTVCRAHGQSDPARVPSSAYSDRVPEGLLVCQVHSRALEARVCPHRDRAKDQRAARSRDVMSQGQRHSKNDTQAQGAHRKHRPHGQRPNQGHTFTD